ncbi:MAG: hypothetical protein COW00_04790 [Bdellovibrio sp. CG12_big_fil_rev_8_21_14_0_65_39_13]|nr:MAG: hypothetical protein COW78_12990 [Bdellovibrio sp. CG22_combo_CG10-13_8_21_14_all_39_27]PIQ61127.1 MAG: hypothetical protein COW00_04790 [Bdellovibrio sp. CG12_big_fil_rev_8_21_14_0_65_39_13]PIR34798.1 MAG: hypothetical protein COV37_11060 [Bdellovibrio sp. CG11_big_fil_rev_8_21_14_0_20_39_38]
MKTKNIVALAVLATTVLSSNSFAQDRRDHRRGERFEVCRPYGEAVRDLSRQLNNFEGEVIRPLMNQLDDQRSRISARQSEDRKLQGAVDSIRNDIKNKERYLKQIPSLIVDAQNSIIASQTALPGLEQERIRRQKDVDDSNLFNRLGRKAKLKDAIRAIENANNNIKNRTQEISQMQSEAPRLPGQIEQLRSSLIIAEQNLSVSRNQQPSMSELTEREIQIRNQLDSQEEMKQRMNSDLAGANQDLSQCKQIDQDAETYQELLMMTHRLRAANCDVELVRNRLPYNLTEAQKRAFSQAARLVCDPVVDDNGGDRPRHQ